MNPSQKNLLTRRESVAGRSDAAVRGNIPKRRFLIGTAGLMIAVLGSGSLRTGPSDAGPDVAQAVPHIAQSNSQNGFTVTLDRVESSLEGTNLFVTLENGGNEPVYFYDVNAEIWQGEKRYEPERAWDSSNELPSELLPGARVAGVIRFPVLDAMAVEAIVRFQRPANAANDWSWDAVEFPLVPTFVPAVKTGATGAPANSPGGAPRRIAIIKADDLRAPSANWDRFIEVSAERQVKVSIGIICDSLLEDETGYFAWLQAQQQSGEVEFWSHGWDHQRLGEGRSVSEFGGSGYHYQKEHLTESQEMILRILGDPPIAFGTPWNEFDRDTVRIVNEDPNLRLFFGHKEGIFEAGKVVVRMLQAEANGTGMPDAAKFAALYGTLKDNLGVIALQFHPGVFQEHHFFEYEQILDLLLQDEWTFMLPRKYIELLDH